MHREILLKIGPPFRAGHNISHKNEITQNGAERSHVPPYDLCITSHSPPRHEFPSNLGVGCRKAAIALQMWRSFFLSVQPCLPYLPLHSCHAFPWQQIKNFDLYRLLATSSCNSEFITVFSITNNFDAGDRFGVAISCRAFRGREIN